MLLFIVRANFIDSKIKIIEEDRIEINLQILLTNTNLRNNNNKRDIFNIRT